MAQKPMLRGEVGARALRVRSDVRGHMQVRLCKALGCGRCGCLKPIRACCVVGSDMLSMPPHASDDRNGAFPAPPKASHDVVGAARVFSKVTVRELLFSRARLICYALTKSVSSPLLWSRSPSVQQARCCPNNFRRQAKKSPFAFGTDGRDIFLGYCGVGRR